MDIRMKIMQRIKTSSTEESAQTLFFLHSPSIPRVGDIIHFGGIWEVVQVIYTSGTDVVLEVREYNNPTQPLITELPLI